MEDIPLAKDVSRYPKYSTLPLTERAAWFGWKRQYKKGSRIFLPTVGASGTDFSGAFRDGYIPSGLEFTTIKRTVKQQQYGWRSLTAAEAQALIRQRNLAPFFQYEPFELTPLLYPRNNSQMA